MVDAGDLHQLRIARDEPPRRSRDPGIWRRWRAWTVLLILLVLVFAGFFFWPGRGSRVHVGVVVASGAGSAGAGGGLTANGYVVARTKASIASKVAGRLAFLGVEEGDRVREGQIVARLESAEYEAAARGAEAERLQAEAGRLDAVAKLTLARQEANRVRTLLRDSLATPQALEAADASLASADAQLRAAEARTAAAAEAVAVARANLENTRIRAPFDGTVLRKDAEVGEVVAPAVTGGGLTRGAVVTMADLSALDVEVEVNEAYIAQVKRGQQAQIVLDAYPSETFPGHVRQILPTAERDRATVLVRIAVDTADPRILSEMGARVVFMDTTEAASSVAAARPTIFVPDSAVHSRSGSDEVWLLERGRAVRHTVTAGPVSGGRREIRQGLAPGDSLLLDPPAGLVDGARVRVAPER